MDDLRSLLAAQDILDAIRHRRYGVVLRRARQARGLTQAQAGRLAGYSAATISRFETGDRRLADIDTLRRISTALDITPELFGLAPGPGETPSRISAASAPGRGTLATVVTITGPPQEEGDDVHRRELLVSLAGISAGAILTPSRAAATVAPDPVSAALEDILAFGPGSAVPVPAQVLSARLAAARQAFHACRYQALARHLPGLVATASAGHVTAAEGTARMAAAAAVADAYALVSDLAEKAGEDSMAWVAADRSLTAARNSGNPATIAASSRAVAISMRRLGHYDAATTMLTRTALSLDADHGDQPAAVLAAYGSLLCTAAYASAQNGRRHQALDLIGEAAAAAARMNGTAAQATFSATTVEVYRIGIHNALGDSVAALTHARAVDQAKLPTPERRAKFWIDTARAWHQHGRPDQACQALAAAGRHAPEEIRRASVKTLITAISQQPGPPPHDLRQLATRAGTTM